MQKELLDSGDESIMILENARKYTPNDTALCPTRLESSRFCF
jgi:hypothetical protein